MISHSPDVNCGICDICRGCPRLTVPPPAELRPTQDENEQYRRLVTEAVKSKIQAAIDGKYSADQAADYTFKIMTVYAAFLQANR